MAKTIDDYDFYCVDYSKRIIDDLSPTLGGVEAKYSEMKNLITRALSVLDKNGLYGFFLSMSWRGGRGAPGEKVLAGSIHSHLIGDKGEQTLLRLKEVGLQTADVEALDMGLMLCRSVDHTFFARELIRRTLTYVRYNIGGGKGKSESEGGADAR